MSNREASFRSGLICWLLVALCATSACGGEVEPRIDAFGDPMPPGAVARLGRTRLRMSSSVLGLRFLADDTQLMTWDRQSTVAFWEVATGKLLRRFHFPVSRLFALSPDDRTLAAVDYDGDILLIDKETGTTLKRLEGHRQSAFELAFSSDSRYLASSTWKFFKEDRAEIRLWDSVKGELVRSIASPEPFPLGMCFAPNRGAFYATVSEKIGGRGKLLRWNVNDNEDGESIAEVSSSDRTLFTPDGRLVLVAGERITAFDPVTGQDRLAIEPGKIWDLAISSRGTVLAGPSHDGPLKRWSLPSGKPLPELPLPHSAASTMAWSLDERKIAFCHLNAIYIIDAETGKLIHPDDDARTAIFHVAVSAGGRHIAAADKPRTQRSIRLWHGGDDDRYQATEFGDPTEAVAGLEFLVDESLLAATTNGKVRTWDVRSQQISSTILETSPFDEFRMSLNGKRAVIADWRWGKVRLVDLATRREDVPEFEKENLSLMIVSPDGNSLVGTDRRQVFEQNLAGKVTRELLPRELDWNDSIARISVSPNGREIVMEFEFDANQSKQSRIIIRDRHTAAVHGSIEIQSEWLHATAISPNSRLIAAGTSRRRGPHHGDVVGGALYLYRMDGRLLARIPLDSPIRSLAFSADGRRLVTGMWDTSLLIWDVAALEAMKTE